VGQSLKQQIEPGAVCVLWKDSNMRRLVRVTRRAGRRDEDWHTKPYFEQGYPEKRVAPHELTLIDNEMELLAWAATCA
jgi:hypothetical protein